MNKIKKVKAKLVSKYKIENKNAPLTDYGIIFAYADSSHSFMSKDVQYMVSFLVEKEKKDFQIEKEIYARLEEGSSGILKYEGKNYIEFSKE